MDRGEESSLVGRTIAGKFAIESYIGGGAMGAVYKARQLALDKTVAIKVMHEDTARDKTFSARFQREAKAASRLDHPNSMRVIDFGEDASGLLYIAMEFLDGRDLFRVIQKDWPLSKERVVDIVSQTLAALAVAHDMGVVHRDLKPENIMVLRGTSDEGQACDLVKVCDFGIAKITDSRSDEKSRGAEGQKLTSHGIVVGTPEYMSPEQGKGELLDARSDLYSVGVILYQLLTGRVPFDAETAIGVVLKHVTEEPIPPSVINPAADPKLEAVCLKAMQKKPADRYQNARLMRTDLRAVVGGPPSHKDALGGRVSLASAATLDALDSDAVNSALGKAQTAAVIAPVLKVTSSKVTPMGTASVAAVATEEKPRRSWSPMVIAALGALVLGVGATVFVVKSQLGAAAPSTTAPLTQVAQVAPAPASSPAPVLTEPPRSTAPVTPAPTAEVLPDDRNDPAPKDSAVKPPHGAPVKPLAFPNAVSASLTASSTATAAVSSAPPEATTTTVAATATAPPEPTSPPAVTTAPPTATAVVAPFDPSKGVVSVSVASVSGGATSASVVRGLGGRAGGWTSCYRNALRSRGTKIEGQASLTLFADESGRVVSARVSGFGAMPGVQACIERSAVGFVIAGGDTGEASASLSLVFRVPE